MSVPAAQRTASTRVAVAPAAIVSIASTLPRLTNATRSHTRSTCSSWCEFSTTVTPRALSPPSSRRNRITPAGSTPEAGSSRNT